MGEYAIDQMMRDYKRMTGVNADRSDFENEKAPAKNFSCPKCGKCFRRPLMVKQHMRDTHKPKEPT